MDKSIWDSYLESKEFPSINKDIETDVAIIGGGITGLSIAYFLMNSNLKVSLFERGSIGGEITSKTTGKITFLQQGLITKINNIYNKETAKQYYKSQKEAINLLTNIIKANNINCDLKNVRSYYFATNNKETKKVKQEKELLISFNEIVKDIYELPDGLNVNYGICTPNTFIFNPIKYLNEIKKIIKGKINIYEESKVTKITNDNHKYILKINNYNVFAKKVVIASHYPYFLLPYLMPLKCSLEKSYIACFKANEDTDFSAISSDDNTLSIRYIDKKDKYKLILTNSHNICTKQNDERNFSPLKSREPDYKWSNVDIITKDYMPYIGSIKENMYIATGYNTWGMTNGTLAGKIISDAILNKENEYANLFSPKRHNNLNTIIKYPLYGVFNTYSFISSKINKQKSWYKNVRIKKINGVNVGIYKDSEGVEHKVKITCPHLGCTLIFNEVDDTWDCPCHASRFDVDGKVLSGPSNYDISFK